MPRPRVFTVASLFTGVGGLDLGFQQEGFRTELATDVMKAAIASYRNNFPGEALEADISRLPMSEIPSSTVLIGGPPCQSFSLVGQRRAGDPRGQLVFRFLDVVRAKRPTVFVLENVPGMAASKVNGVRLPDVLTARFEELGYFVVQMKLNAFDFLVPQRRKRLFLIGSLIGPVPLLSPEAYLKVVCGAKTESISLSASAAIGDLGDPVSKGRRASYGARRSSRFAQLMRTPGLLDVSLHEQPRMSSTDLRLVSHIPQGGNYRDVPDSASTARIMKFKATGGRTTTYGRLHPDRPAFTINTYFRRPNVGCNFHYEEPRLITAREAMRFQGIPDRFELSFSSQDERNRLIGNAVPPPLARAVAMAVRLHLSGAQR